MRAKDNELQFNIDGHDRPVRPAIILPIFDDRNDGQTIEEYLFRFEKCAKANMWRDSDKLDQIYHYLRGNAEKCYEEVISKDQDSTWLKLKNLLIDKFTHRHGKVTALDCLLGREQGSNESFRNYFYEKLKLINQLNKGMKIEDKILFILQGTRSDMKRDVKRQFYQKKFINDVELYSSVIDIERLDEMQKGEIESSDASSIEGMSMKARLEMLEKENAKLRDRSLRPFRSVQIPYCSGYKDTPLL